MCANPRCKHILTLELHHIEWIKDDGNNDVSNLIALCSNCHDLHTRGHIPRSAIDTWKCIAQIELRENRPLIKWYSGCSN